MKLPEGLNNLVEFLQRLPGVGQKSALRMAFYLLQTPDSFNNELSTIIGELKKNVFVCSECFSVADEEICEVCKDNNRNKQLICVSREVFFHTSCRLPMFWHWPFQSLLYGAVFLNGHRNLQITERRPGKISL